MVGLEDENSLNSKQLDVGGISWLSHVHHSLETDLRVAWMRLEKIKRLSAYIWNSGSCLGQCRSSLNSDADFYINVIPMFTH